MALLGAYVAARFPEDNFHPHAERRWTGALLIFRQGLGLARRDGQILLMFTATMLVNGAAITTWLFPRQLVDLGFPHDLVLWYTGLGIAASAAGVVALRIVAARIDGVRAARASYAVACLLGMFGLVALAEAPDALAGCLAALAQASGIAATLLTAAALLGGTGALVARSRAG